MSKKLINIITNDTQQVIKSAGITKKLEFVDGDNNPVPEGIPYHIHITPDKSYWYMTSAEHESNSIVIFRNDGNDSDYVKYRKLVGSQNQKYLSEKRTRPTLRDYENGFFTMYFARQANDIDAKIFEISKEDFNIRTPFYTKTFINLRITGEKNSVERENKEFLSLANRKIPGLSDIVPPLQYFKEEKNTKESVQDRLKNYKQVIPSTTSGGSSGGSSGGGSYS